MTLVACGSVGTPRAVVTRPHAVDVSADVALAEHFEEWTTSVKVGEYVATQAFLASLYTPPVDPPPALQTNPVAGGTRSAAWWESLATCESGDTNAWRTGYYGLESGSPVGGMSKDQQLAMAEGIYAQYGDSAWGCAPVAWSEVPGG